jgi:hypothetical protein
MEAKMGKSTEFNRDGDPSVKNVITKSGPLGLLPILLGGMSLLIVIAAIFWWAS